MEVKSSTRIPGFGKVVLIIAWLGVAGVAPGDESELATSQDCAEIILQSPDDELLTREEKIALLEKALLRSMDEFDSCQSTASGANNGVAAGDAGAAIQGDQATQESTPASDIQGDIQEDLSASQASGEDQNNTTTTNTADAGKAGTVRDEVMPPNGKLPEDIPSVENDDIIAKQFRQAAMDETDPATKAKLWNEYRRYKGLPVKEVANEEMPES